MIAAAAAHGAHGAFSQPVRLPHEVAPLFEAWLRRHYPDRADKVLNHIRAMRGGKLNDPRFGERMVGGGVYFDAVRARFRLACARHGLVRERIVMRTDLFRPPRPRRAAGRAVLDPRPSASQTALPEGGLTILPPFREGRPHQRPGRAVASTRSPTNGLPARSRANVLTGPWPGMKVASPKGQSFSHHRAHQLAHVAAGQVGAADRALEQHVADDREARRRVVEDDVAGRMAGGEEHAERLLADGHRVAVGQPAVGRERGAAGDAVLRGELGDHVEPELVRDVGAPRWVCRSDRAARPPWRCGRCGRG